MWYPFIVERQTSSSLAWLSRIGKVLVTLLFLALLPAYFYLRFHGWSHPIAKLFGVYKYKIVTLTEYAEWKRDPTFDERHGIAVGSFDCEQIRDEFVKITHEKIISDEAVSFGGPGKVLDMYVQAHLLGAWRESTVLHMASPNATDSGPSVEFIGKTFSAWKNQVAELATVQHPPEEGHYGSLLQALFTQVVIHGANKNEVFTVTTRISSKFDACGPPREGPLASP